MDLLVLYLSRKWGMEQKQFKEAGIQFMSLKSKKRSEMFLI